MENKLKAFNLECLNNDFFRMILFGASQSGKTHCILHKLLPVLKKRYHRVILISPQNIKGQYQQIIPKHAFSYINCHEFKKGYEMSDVLKMLQQLIENTKIGRTQDGHDKFKFNTLIILDDAVSEKVDPQLQLAFCRMRHYQCSIVFVSQHTAVLTSPMMISNSNYILLFNMTGSNKLKCCNILSSYVNGSSEKDIKGKSMRLYDEWVVNSYKKSYHCLFLVDGSQIFYL